MIRILLLGCIIMLSISNVSATWMDEDYDFRQPVILTGNTSGAQTNYQILLNITYDSDMNTNFDDLRFYNDTHQIDAWLESKVDSSYTLVWVEFPTTPSNTVEETYYMYYGNISVGNVWNGANTFIVYDDFSTDLLGTYWAGDTGSFSVVSGKLSSSTTGATIYKTVDFSNLNNYKVYAKMKSLTPGTPIASHYTYSTTGTGNTNTGLRHTGDCVWMMAHSNDAQTKVVNAFTDNNANTETFEVRGASNTYEDYIITKIGSEYKYYHEGSLRATRTPTLITPSYFILDCGSWNGWWDMVHLSKTASAPATYTFGSEEAAPSIPPTPTNLQSEIIGMDIKHTWNVGTGNVTDSYNVSVNMVWHNLTINTYWQAPYDYSEWQNITVWAYNNTGYLSLSSVSNNTPMPAAPVYTPPTPTNLQSEIINKIIKHTWSAGTGNVTDSYNVSVNTVWHNSTTHTYWQAEYAFNEWQNITVWAYNNTGCLSLSSISNQTQITRPPYEASPEGEGVGYKLKDNEIKSFFVPMIYLIFIAIILGGFIKEIK